MTAGINLIVEQQEESLGRFRRFYHAHCQEQMAVNRCLMMGDQPERRSFLSRLTRRQELSGSPEYESCLRAADEAYLEKKVLTSGLGEEFHNFCLTSDLVNYLDKVTEGVLGSNVCDVAYWGMLARERKNQCSEDFKTDSLYAGFIQKVSQSLIGLPEEKLKIIDQVLIEYFKK
ncbi:MAG: hypothetical protein KJ597_02420 [Nanoarchaeota archaeon]|nr:hypothetical protein [Nanoarchaeota archaeon]MBU1622405.1 hypothetical protein [Nanoarchaeota archaeon]